MKTVISKRSQKKTISAYNGSIQIKTIYYEKVSFKYCHINSN